MLVYRRCDRGNDMNLDCMEIDELWALWKKASGVRPVKAGREWFPGKPEGYVSAAKQIGNYAANKATAMRLRLGGKIAQAMVYEGICDSIYCHLPDYAKW